MGSRNLKKWFADEVNNIDHIAAIFVGLTEGDPKDLNTQAHNELSSIWYTLSKHIFKSIDVVHRRRLYNLWMENRKGIRDKYYALAKSTPNTPKLVQGRMVPKTSDGVYRCFCEKNITWNQKVNMIMCDNCGSFYHEFCVLRGHTGDTSSFVCPNCSGNQLVPPLFWLTPEQSSMVSRKTSTLIQSSQCASEDGDNNDTGKPLPKNLDAEFAAESTSDEIIETKPVHPDSETSDRQSKENDTLSEPKENEKIRELSENENCDFSVVDNIMENDSKESKRPKEKGIMNKVRSLLQSGRLGMPKRKPKPEEQSILISDLENVLELLRNQAEKNTSDERYKSGVHSESQSEAKATDDNLPEIQELRNEDDDDQNHSNDEIQEVRDENDDDHNHINDDEIPSDVEFDDVLKTPDDSDNDCSDICENGQAGGIPKDDYNHFDNDKILDDQESINSETANDNNDGVNDVPKSNIFEPFTILIEKDKWKKIMDIGPRNIELDDGTKATITFHSVNPKNFHDTLYDKFMEIWPACTPTTTKTKLKQPNELINSTAAYLRVYADCNRKPICTAKFAFTLPTIPEDNEDVVEFRVRKTGGIVAHSANEQATRQIRGEKREVLKEKLKTDLPSVIRTLAFADADVAVLELGNFSKIPKLKVMHNIQSERTKQFRLSDDDFYDLLLLSNTMNNEYGKTVKGYIQSLSAKPFRIVLYTEANLRAFRLVNTSASGACLFFDATSSIVTGLKPPHDTARPFLYTLLLKGYSKHKPIAISEMLTTMQTSYNISVMLGEFFQSYRYMFKDRRKYYGISQIETDFSKAIIGAVIRALENSSLEEYLNKLWYIMKNPSQRNEVLALHVCRWHFHKFFSKYLKNVMKGKPLYAEQIRLWTAWSYRLVTMKDLWTFHRLIEDVSVILSDKYYSDEVRNRVESMNKKTSREGIPFWEGFDATCTSDDAPLWLRVQFGYYADTVFMKIIEKRSTRTKMYTIGNPYKCHTLLKYIMRSIFPFVAILSHAIFHIKGIAVIHDTQGHMENHFKQLKHDKMRRKKFGTVGDFVRKEAVYTKGETTRFLVELPLHTKSENPKTVENAIKITTNEPKHHRKNPSAITSKTMKNPGFIFPGKQGSKSNEGKIQKKKPTNVATSAVIGGTGNLSKSRDEFKSTQNFLQKSTGSLENIFEAAKSLGKQGKKKHQALSKSSESLIKTTHKVNDAQKRAKDWKGSIKNFFGATEKSKPEKNEMKATGNETNASQNTTNIQSEIETQQNSKKLIPVEDDDDSSDNAIPKSKSVKERFGKRNSPEFAEEKFKAEQKRREAKVPATFFTLMTRIPWGGTFKYRGAAYKFSNTCPIDNFLQLFYALYEHNDKGRSFIDNIRDPVGETMKKSIELIREEKFASAKANWLISTNKTEDPLKKYLNKNGMLDLYDCQSVLAWSKIYNWFPVFEISWCDTKNCPMNETRNKKVVLVDSLIRNHINDTISLFNVPYTAARPCEFCKLLSRQKTIEFLDPSPDIFFYECEGWTGVPNGKGGGFTFVPTCLEQDMVLEQNLGGIVYDVFGYVLKDRSRDHFVAVFVENGRKILYDGLNKTLYQIPRGTLTVCNVVLVKR